MKHSSINCNIHDDPEFRKLKLETRYLYFYLVTHPNIHLTGLYRCALTMMTHHTGITLEQVKSSISELEDAGYARYDYASESVFLLKYYKEQLANQKVSKLTKATDNRFKSIARYFMDDPSNLFWGDFVRQNKEALSQIFADLPQELQALAKANKPVTKPESESKTGTKTESGKPAAVPAAAPAALEAPPAQPAAACLPASEENTEKKKTPDARLALAAAPNGPLAQAAAPVVKESRNVDEYVESEEDAADPRREHLMKCYGEYQAVYSRQQLWKSKEFINGYELDDECMNPSFFRVHGQNTIAQQYELPLDLIKEHRLVIYLLRNRKDRSRPPTIWVRDVYGHIVQLQWIQFLDSTTENTHRIKTIRRPANRKVQAFAKLPEVILEEAEVTPPQVTAVEPQEEAMQTSSEGRLEFLKHLDLQELDSKLKADNSVGLHDDCWKQNFKTEEHQNALAKRFGLPIGVLNQKRVAIVLKPSGCAIIVNSFGRAELEKNKDPFHLEKEENRRILNSLPFEVQDEPHADEPAAEENYEPDF